MKPAGSNPAREHTGRHESRLGLRVSLNCTSRSEQDGLEQQTPSHDDTPPFWGSRAPSALPSRSLASPGSAALVRGHSNPRSCAEMPARAKKRGDSLPSSKIIHEKLVRATSPLKRAPLQPCLGAGRQRTFLSVPLGKRLLI